MAELDAVTLNARLLDGDRLLVSRDAGGRVVACVVEFLDDKVPVGLFNSYASNGLIEPTADGSAFKITKEGKKRLKASPRRDDARGR